jgi:hypothetical protein
MSWPPPDHGSTPETARFQGDPDADTGPLHVVWPNSEETSAVPTSMAPQVRADDWSQEYHSPPDDDQALKTDDDQALKTRFWHADAPGPSNSTMLAETPPPPPPDQSGPPDWTMLADATPPPPPDQSGPPDWTVLADATPPPPDQTGPPDWTMLADATPPPPPDQSGPPDYARPPNSTMVAALPPQDSIAGRFTPMTVDPRATNVKSTGIKPSKVLAIVGVFVLVAALAFVLFRVFEPGSDDNAGGATITATPADQEKLKGLVPRGYAAGSCTPTDTPRGTLAKMSCTANTDVGGPPSATYTLVADKAALTKTFDGLVSSARQMTCPGNIQSPGPWRRIATQVVAGTVFCGFRDDIPTVVWTDETDLLIASVDGAQAGPNLDQLYTWWASHS